MRTVYLTFSFEEEDQEEGSIEITEAVIHFSDGSVVETEIGAIYFHIDEERTEVLESHGGSGSGPIARREFSVKEDIELVGVESPVLPIIRNDLELKINGRDYREIEGMNIEAGDVMLVESNTQGSTPFREDLQYLKFRPKLRFISGSDTEETRTLLVGWFPIRNYEFMDIVRYLRQREALSW